jgi:serine/threonine-protein kinase
MSEIPSRLTTALADRYTIERELGRGGMAVVYLARDEKLSREVALKVLRPELAASLGAERFLREIEIAAKLTHPNILALYDCGEADRQLYYTMPFIEGESLRDRLTREKQLPIEDALAITTEVADALGHAHSLGIVHRDIKPENILFQGGHAVVADFGIARAVSEAGGETLTETGLAVGTPVYMSPEQATGTKEIDARTDIYSLASVLYEMLSGEPPFTAPSHQALIAKKLSEPTPRISVVRERISASVEAALDKALSKTPADRHNTATEFAEQLDSPASRESGERAGVGWWQRGRNKRLALGGVVAIAVLAAGVAVFRGSASGSAEWPLGVAVLPLDNLSADPSNTAFADGLHSEVISRLWDAGLRGPPRGSMLQYREVRPQAREIADRHNVSHVLETTVRWGVDTVIVTAVLVDARRDEPVWMEDYPRALSAHNLLAVQETIARGVAAALFVALTPAADRRLAERPTSSVEAYLYYLGGKALDTGTLNDLRKAVDLFERAVVADPEFAEAWAELGRVRLGMLWHGTVEERISLAKEALDRAVALGPELPVTQFALAWYEGLTHGDLDSAARMIERVRREQPFNTEAILMLAAVRRDQGQWRESQALRETVLELDPGAGVDFGLGFLHLSLREYAAAEGYVERAILLGPGRAYPLLGRIYVPLMRDGDIEAAREGIQDMLLQLPASEVLYEFGKISLPQHYPYRRILLAALEPALRDSTAAASLRDQCESCLWLLQAEAAARRGDTGAPRAYHDSIVTAWDAVLVSDQLGPQEWQAPMILGTSYAQLGDSLKAITAAERAAELMPPSRNAYLGPQVILALAEVYLLVGDDDSALETLERFLSHPSVVSPQVIALDPLWEPLQADPRLRALLDQAPRRF